MTWADWRSLAEDYGDTIETLAVKGNAAPAARGLVDVQLIFCLGEQFYYLMRADGVEDQP